MADTAELTGSVVRFLDSHNGQRIAICAYSVFATIVLMAYPGTSAALVFGLPYLFFIPGFALVRLTFWKNTSMEAKFVLSMGLSILVVIFLGLFLVLTPIGLNSDTTRLSMILFSLGAVALEFFVWPADRYDEKEAEQRETDIREEPFKLDKVVVAMLGTALVVSAISLGLIITAEYPSRTYYAMTDESGSADINTTYALGTNLTLMIEMHNGEDGARTFTLYAYHANLTAVSQEQRFNYTLASGDTVNQSVTFSLNEPGVFRLVFLLYIQEEGHDMYVYSENPVQLWIEVV
ncbi:MAG: DUF1616 domain-containing protein [Methanobacteriota archaeon]|nr:MAG: DUF1616 domain-containing protein [Euryarchaeota archaeon]